MKYYIASPNTKRPEEVSEETYLACMGREEIRQYTRSLYAKKITTDQVPEEIRDEVVACVNARIQRFGEYRKEG